MKAHAVEHGFHVHAERHFIESYSLGQAWEVDLHPEEACLRVRWRCRSCWKPIPGSVAGLRGLGRTGGPGISRIDMEIRPFSVCRSTSSGPCHPLPIPPTLLILSTEHGVDISGTVIPMDGAPPPTPTCRPPTRPPAACPWWAEIDLSATVDLYQRETANCAMCWTAPTGVSMWLLDFGPAQAGRLTPIAHQRGGLELNPTISD